MIKNIYEVDENYFQIDQLKRKAFGQFLLLFESNTNCESNHLLQQIMIFFFQRNVGERITRFKKSMPTLSQRRCLTEILPFDLMK